MIAWWWLLVPWGPAALVVGLAVGRAFALQAEVARLTEDLRIARLIATVRATAHPSRPAPVVEIPHQSKESRDRARRPRRGTPPR